VNVNRVAPFDARPDGVGIIFSADVMPKTQAANGDRVVLRIGRESVLVKNVVVLGVTRFSGEVFGFEPSFSDVHAGICVGDVVEFDHGNVVSCGS
jgi:hypothetical protein